MKQTTGMLTWLKLMRLPTVFTAVSNILCGYLLTHVVSVRELPAQADLWWLLLAGAGLYLGGMVLNDVCDAELDRIERPERPIPAGRISRTAAALLAAVMLGTGLIAAFVVGRPSGLIAVLLAAAVIAYDMALKKTIAGGVGMGVCRFLNLLLGASAVPSAAMVVQMPHVGIAGALLIYVAGVTWFARHEAQTSARFQLLTGLAICLLAILANAGVIAVSDFPSRPSTGAWIALGLVAANIGFRCVKAIHSGQPRLVQKTVGILLMNIIFIDATMVFAATGDARLAALIVALVIPATLLKRIIPLS